jgi:ribosome biogenesis GTPase A|tara:strand:+ start:204 stop:1118 length:915 start_codon:yes stop_codon:yes gene_type:complete
MPSKKRYKASQDKIKYKLSPDRKTEDRINWFPGHMNKAIKDIKSKLKLIDIVFEIRDARLPLLTHNPALDEAIGNKEKIILLNKSNLADPESSLLWQKWFAEQGQNAFFINAFDFHEAQVILHQAKELVNQKKQSEQRKLNILILGLPNTGKSTLINKFAAKNIAKAADKPGQTRQQQWIKLAANTELLDTPGIMPPRIETQEQGLKLAAIHAIPDRIVSDEKAVIYLIEYFLNHKHHHLYDRYKLDLKQRDTISILDSIGKNRGCLLKDNQIDYLRVYKIFLQDFREGKLGRHTLETPPITVP